MGQAKDRGSRDDRLAQALGLKQYSIEDFKQKLGMPDDAVFLGYIVHIPEKDEFLGDIKDSPQMTKRVFANKPDYARTFENISDAHKVARKEIFNHGGSHAGQTTHHQRSSADSWRQPVMFITVSPRHVHPQTF